MPNVRILSAALLGLLLLPASAGAQNDAAEKKAAIESHLAECTATHGYDPEAANPEKALAPGERAWNDCAYDGVRALLAKQSRIPGIYDLLIDQHRDMTDALERGEITRTQRKQRTDAIAASIRNQEEALVQDEIDRLRKRQTEMQNQLRHLQDLQRDILRHQRVFSGRF